MKTDEQRAIEHARELAFKSLVEDADNDEAVANAWFASMVIEAAAQQLTSDEGGPGEATRNAVLVNEMLAAVGSKFRLTVRGG